MSSSSSFSDALKLAKQIATDPKYRAAAQKLASDVANYLGPIIKKAVSGTARKIYNFCTADRKILDQCVSFAGQILKDVFSHSSAGADSMAWLLEHQQFVYDFLKKVIQPALINNQDTLNAFLKRLNISPAALDNVESFQKFLRQAVELACPEPKTPETAYVVGSSCWKARNALAGLTAVSAYARGVYVATDGTIPEAPPLPEETGTIPPAPPLPAGSAKRVIGLYPKKPMDEQEPFGFY